MITNKSHKLGECGNAISSLEVLADVSDILIFFLLREGGGVRAGGRLVVSKTGGGRG